MPTSRPVSVQPKGRPEPLLLDATQRLALAKALDAELCALERGRNEALAHMTTRLAPPRRRNEDRRLMERGRALRASGRQPDRSGGWARRFGWV